MSNVEEDYDDAMEEEEEDETLGNPDVIQKYKMVGEFVNTALKTVIAHTKPGAKVVTLCELGDTTMNDLLGTIFSKYKTGENKIERSVAMPTCVSVNSVVCHFSPFSDDETELKEGDVVRIDCGCQVDGYPAVGAHTVVVQETAKPVDGKLAAAMHAAHTCLDLGVRSVRPGNTNTQLTAQWQEITEAYGCNFVEGVLSHQVKRWEIDAEGVINGKNTVDAKVEELTFEPLTVWAIDVLVSTGAGKLRERDCRPYVYKRLMENQFNLKLKAGRETVRHIEQTYNTFPFALRALTNRTARLGIAECVKHDLVTTLPVLYEREGEVVVHLKTTVLVSNNAIMPITGLPVDMAQFTTDKKLESAEIADALKKGLQLKGRKKKKKSKAAKEGDAAAEE